MPGQQPDSRNGGIAVTNGCVVAPEGLSGPWNVLTRDGRIAAVGPSEALQAPKDAFELDATGMLILPGFVDVRAGVQVQMDAAGSAVLHGTLGQELARGGVTRFLPRIAPSSAAEMRDALYTIGRLQRHTSGARPIGLRVESPLGIDQDAGVSADEAREIVRLARESVPPERTLVVVPTAGAEALEFISWVASTGATVGVALDGADCHLGREAIDAGARYATGALDALNDLHHREPGAVAAALLDDRVAAELPISGGAVHRPAIDLVVRAKGPERCTLTAANGTQRVAGMPQAVRCAAGIPSIGIAAASCMASGGWAALQHGNSPLRGVLEGMIADLVVLTREFDVVATLVEGILVHQRDAA